MIDAVFADPNEHAAAEQLAMRSGVPFAGLWLEAPVAVLEKRLEQRRDDASDATPEIMRLQLRYATGTITWNGIAAGENTEDTAAAARAVLGL